MKIKNLKCFNFFCLLSSTLIISSCSLFDQGDNKRNNSTDLIAAGELGASCSSNSECGQDYICSSGVCVADPVIGAECETNSDCGNSILYICDDGVCKKNVAQEVEAEFNSELGELHALLLNYNETFTSSPTECKSGVAQDGTSKCGCSSTDDPCGISTTDGQICKSTKVCGNPGLAHSDFYIPDVETAPYGFENIYVISGGANTIACNGNDVKLPMDLNTNVGGDFIYFCFKYASKGETAVNGIYFTNVSNPTPQSGYTLIGPDLNDGAGGKYIYTFIRKGSTDVIKKFRLSMSFNDGGTNAIANCIDSYNDNGYTIAGPDLNDGAGQPYIYACYKR